MIVDLFLVYQFVRRLATPFESWDAFRLGIIDKDGNVLKKRRDLNTMEERKAFGWFDLMLLNIKKTLAKLPGGATKLATYAAALYLIKEHKLFTDQENLTESEITDEQIQESISVFFRTYSDYTTSPETVNQINELFETSYPITWNKSSHKWKGTFTAGPGPMIINIEEQSEGWVIDFSASDEGDQWKILATVLHGVGEFIKEVKPDEIMFNAEKRPRHVVTMKGKKKIINYKVSDARIKIYTRLVKKFAAEVGYEPHFNELSFNTTFILVRKKGLREDAPAVSVGSGGIAGLGVGPDGEPGLTKKQQSAHRKRASAVIRRRVLESITKNEADPLKDHGVHKTAKQPKRPKPPIA